jgi:hypothetical protein
MKVDALCTDSNVYHPPIWNDIQAQSINTHDELELCTVKTTFIGGPTIDPSVLLESEAEILVCIDSSQHPFGIHCMRELREKYKKLILVADEPIWAPGAHSNAKGNHENLIKSYSPDLVFYPSNIDKDLSFVKSESWYSCFDHLIPNKPPLSEKIHQYVMSSSSSSIWNGRREFRDMLSTLKNLPIVQHVDQSYHVTTDTLKKSTVCVIPPHPLGIHWLRFLRAWHTGCIPVVVNSPGWLEREDINNSYKDILDQDKKTCILTDTDNLETILERLQEDSSYRNELLQNIQDLDLSEYGSKATWDKVYNII